MKTIQITIPDMQSAHCQARVQNALGSLEGIHVNEIQAGQVTIALNDPQQQSAVTAAIEKAGYTVAGVASENEPQAGALSFKTNINCGGCVASVRPALDGNSGIAEWHVDTLSKDKILTVKTAGATPEEIINTVKTAGFKIEPVL